MKLVSSALFSLFLASSAFAGTRYVNVALTTGANDGSTWANAYQGTLGLQSALGSAVAGDALWVAQGTYKPAPNGSPSVSFVLKSGVEIYGGFAGTETQLDQRDPAAHVTILTGDLANNDNLHVYTDNTWHVVDGGTADSSALLDGFTIQGGSAGGTEGGGMLCLNGCTPGIRNCVFRGNRALNGAAVYIDSASPRFHYTRFEDNHAGGLGGAFRARLSSLLNFTGCTFAGNLAGSGGAGSTDSVLSLNLTNCVIRDNTVDGSFSGLGGAALLLQATAASIDGCTITGNHSLGGECAGVRVLIGNVVLTNSIVYFNVGQQGGSGTLDNVMGVTTSWCCIQGGHSGSGILTADPLFVDRAAGDVHLLASSPCCDAGNNSLVPGTSNFDLDGNPRLFNNHYAPDSGVGSFAIVDMGAYETTDPLYLPFCAGDGSLATACPCGNFGVAGRGCRNSDLFSVGALLEATGSVAADTVVLEGSDLLPSVTCVFLQGSQSLASGAVFGDGVRCVAGSLKRLYVKQASAGAVSAPGAADPSIRVRSAALGDTIAQGTLREYQVYYRDPDLNFCSAPAGNSWNVTSGVIIAW